MTELIFGVLIQGLKLWNQKESTKYLDEVYSLQKDWLNEINKPRSERDNSNLDAIQLRLDVLGKLFIASGKPNP